MRQATIEALLQAVEAAKSKEIDGCIIILSQENKSDPHIIMAGRLTRKERALLNVAKLKIRLVVE